MSTKFEYNNTGTNIAVIYPNKYHGQTFTPQAAHTITSVKLLLYRYGNTLFWHLHADIYLADGAHKPTGAVLCTGSKAATSVPKSPAAWYELTLGDGSLLSNGTEYVIVMRATDANSSNHPRTKYSSTGDPYARGVGLYSTDNGANWTVYSTRDYRFEDWGDAVAGGWTGKVSGVTNPAKVMGVDVANIAKVHGVA